MTPRRRKGAREKNLTEKYLAGDLDEDRLDRSQRFGDRHKHAKQSRIERTAEQRAEVQAADLETLPVGQVIQVFSLYIEVQHDQTTYLCTVRKTMTRLSDTAVIVGDRVRFRPTGTRNESDQPEATIEQILPRQTVVTRADSFHSHEQRPIVANAEQMLIVASLRLPRVRWGLIDRMLIAARSGGLVPIICLNKMDLARDDRARKDLQAAQAVLAHYASMGLLTLQTSVPLQQGLDALRDLLKGRTTVLAGHSGVGKSSLIRSIQPQLDLRIGAVSRHSEKGRHTTTSARYYPLDFDGAVVDTPGVKLFGLWEVTSDTLDAHYPDIADGSAPKWRLDSRDRILRSLAS